MSEDAQILVNIITPRGMEQVPCFSAFGLVEFSPSSVTCKVISRTWFDLCNHMVTGPDITCRTPEEPAEEWVAYCYSAFSMVSKHPHFS